MVSCTTRRRDDIVTSTTIVEKDAKRLTKREAQRLTKELRASLESALGTWTTLYRGSAHLALGYETWPEYVVAEFDTLPRFNSVVERRDVVKQLAGTGMTQREIGATLGVDASTANRDLNADKSRKARAIEATIVEDVRPDATLAPIVERITEEEEIELSELLTIIALNLESFIAASPEPELARAARSLLVKSVRDLDGSDDFK